MTVRFISRDYIDTLSQEDKDKLLVIALGDKATVADIDYLIDSGANINWQNGRHQTVGHYLAAHPGNVMGLRTALDHGLDPSIQDKDGNTVLHEAIKAKNEAAIRLLYKRNPELFDMPNYKGQIPSNLSYVNDVIEDLKPPLPTPPDDPLMKEKLKILRDQVPDVDWEVKNGPPPYFYAAGLSEEQQKKVAEVLAKHEQGSGMHVDYAVGGGKVMIDSRAIDLDNPRALREFLADMRDALSGGQQRHMLAKDAGPGQDSGLSDRDVFVQATKTQTFSFG